MIKTISLLHAKSGMGHRAFVDRYEAVHVPLVEGLLGPFRNYRRNFVMPEDAAPGIAAQGAVRPGFDAMTAIWFDDQDALAALGAKLAEGNAASRITADEMQMFDRMKMAMFMVDERSIVGPPPGAVPVAPAGSKLILLGARDRAIPDDAFVAQCDADCARLAADMAEQGVELTGLMRNHVVPGGIFDLGHIEGHSAVVDFDLILEIGCGEPAGMEAFLAAALAEGAGFTALQPVASLGGFAAFLATERG